MNIDRVILERMNEPLI